MLTNDAAADDDKMAAIMELRVSIHEHFQPKDEHGNCVPLIGADGKSGYEDVLPSQVMGLIAEDWSVAIRKACKLEVDSAGVDVEDEDRIIRMATYTMMVNVDRTQLGPNKMDQLFHTILKGEPLYNIDPNNPPRFQGAALVYVRLKQDQTPAPDAAEGEDAAGIEVNTGTPHGTSPGPDTSGDPGVSFGYGPVTQREAAIPFGSAELAWGSSKTRLVFDTAFRLCRGYMMHSVCTRCFMLAPLLCDLLARTGGDTAFWEEQEECGRQKDCVDQTRRKLAQQGVEGVQEALQRA